MFCRKSGTTSGPGLGPTPAACNICVELFIAMM